MDEKVTSNSIQDTNNEEFTIPHENSSTKIGTEGSSSDSSITACFARDHDDDKSAVTSLSKPSIICRICLTNNECDRLLTPCQCKGTHAFVHRQCLENWLSRSGLDHCELCLFRFATANYLRFSDILLCTLLTIITFGLVVIAMFGMYFMSASPSSSSDINAETTKYWTETSIVVFLGIVNIFQIFAFLLNAIVVIRANLIPWFRWWRRCKEIQLVIENNIHSSINNNNSMLNV
ncbi:unnamed protein product [Chironomus riparius]|uniref:RING-CH-type domain-containing protein n=1 Tax=Chironomus riparius TaxID=315576 RepID=A0A9N9WKS7_9DIPT|nr:unnamed protein product [Chironomus riparius]